MGEIDQVAATLGQLAQQHRDSPVGALFGGLLALLEEQLRQRTRTKSADEAAARQIQQMLLGGDLRGTPQSATVVGIQNQPWAPQNLGPAQQGLIANWNGLQWVAQSVMKVLPPLTRTRFVDAGTTVPVENQNGQEWAPYGLEQYAFDEIAEGPLDADWAVVIRRPSGLSFSVPYRRRIVVRGEFRAAQLGPITWTIGGPTASSVLNLRNLACGPITVRDHASGPAAFAVLALESVICGGVDNLSTGSLSEFHVLATGPVSSYIHSTTSTSGQFAGPVQITGLAGLLNFETQDGVPLQAAGLLARNTAFGGALTLTDKTCELLCSSWKFSPPTLAFVGDPGAVLADSLTTYNARKMGLVVTGGTFAPFVDGQAGPFSIGTAIEGALYYNAGGGIAGLAQANAASTSCVVGVYANLAGHLGAAGRIYPVLFPPGLVLSGGEPVYLSPSVAGLATTVRPSLDGEQISLIGWVNKPYQYSPATGGLALVLLQPTEPISTASEGREVVLAQLDTSGIWFPDEWIGPSSGPTSTPTPDAGFGFGCGFWVAPSAGRLRGFTLTNASFSLSPLAYELWIAPLGNPALFAFSGLTVPIPDSTYLVVDSSTVQVSAGDLIGIRNASALVGYTSGGLRLASRFIAD